MMAPQSGSAADRGRAHPATYTAAQPLSDWFTTPDSQADAPDEDRTAVGVSRMSETIGQANDNETLSAEREAAVAAKEAQKARERAKLEALARQVEMQKHREENPSSYDKWINWSAKFYMPWLNRMPNNRPNMPNPNDTGGGRS